MLNSQNVTLMAEIVDHDVTYFDESLKDNGEEVMSQINQTYNTLRNLIGNLLILKLLPDGFTSFEALKGYADGIKSKLRQEDQRRILNALKQSYDMNRSPSEFDRYKDGLRLTQDPELRRIMGEDETRKREGYLKEFDAKLRYDPFNKKWVNKADIGGSGSTYFLMSKLINVDDDQSLALTPDQSLRRTPSSTSV
jgi:hypothetical protein